MLIHDIKSAQKQIQRLDHLLGPEEISKNYGRLYLDQRGNELYCYERVFKKGELVKKEYLGPCDSPRVKEFCSIEYRRELKRRLIFNADLLERTLSELKDCSPTSIVGALPRACQLAMSRYEHLWESSFVNERYEELKKWASDDYEKNTMEFPDSENYAKDGTRVRSKGECVIYNILLDMGIPFRYDSIIKVSDQQGRIKHLSPDFMIQCFDGNFIVIEHLGQLGDMRYAMTYGDKCYWYLQGGFVLGKNYFVTSDDANHGTDSEAISKILCLVEKLFYGY